MTLLIISVSVCAIIVFTGCFIILYQVVGDELDRRDAANSIHEGDK
ncbi:MAG: hypothetical protein WC455_16760 [Dehalococcoidia bacterium]|jgi:hypothetical protein